MPTPLIAAVDQGSTTKTAGLYLI